MAMDKDTDLLHRFVLVKKTPHLGELTMKTREISFYRSLFYPYPVSYDGVPIQPHMTHLLIFH